MLSRGYRGGAVFLLNTLLAFVGANLLCALVLQAGGLEGASTEQPGFAAPGSAAFATARRVTLGLGLYPGVARFYPDLTNEQFADFMVETHARPFVYEPFTQFKERPYRGTYVNVDVNGFRRGPEQGPWPPEPAALRVFVFGGSTTFGFKLPDDQTVPAHLQSLLGATAPGRPVRVYNFARGYYFSTQERMLFERLVGAGHAPELAVFVDGLSDFYNVSGEPELTARLRALVDRGSPPRPNFYLDLLRQLPVGRAAAWLRQRISRNGLTAAAHAALAQEGPAGVEAVIDRYRRNKRLIEAVAGAHGVRPVFVWQPVPIYKYDLGYHAFADKGFARHELSRLGYPAMAEAFASGALGPDFIWCADIQENLHEELYLDEVHYTPAMARRVARCIADGIVR